jgi:hypothetical protein
MACGCLRGHRLRRLGTARRRCCLRFPWPPFFDPPDGRRKGRSDFISQWRHPFGRATRTAPAGATGRPERRPILLPAPRQDLPPGRGFWKIEPPLVLVLSMPCVDAVGPNQFILPLADETSSSSTCSPAADLPAHHRHRAGARPARRHRGQPRPAGGEPAPGEPPADAALRLRRVRGRPDRRDRRPAGRPAVGLARLQALLEGQGRQAGQRRRSAASRGSSSSGPSCRSRASSASRTSRSSRPGARCSPTAAVPRAQGRTFRTLEARSSSLGYTVEHRELRACDYGAPTIRKRLFLVARCDGQPIVWPAPTHGPGLKPYRTAAECIDWSLPCPSIFERERPLAEATHAAHRARHQALRDRRGEAVHRAGHAPGRQRVQPIDEPLRTVTTPSAASSRSRRRR